MSWNDLCKEERKKVEVKGARLVSFEGGAQGDSDKRKSLEEIALLKAERNRWWRERYKEIGNAKNTG